MNEPSRRQSGPRRAAIDINDLVYAVTGARVRRLTMPDGVHWFPAVDVCRELGHSNTSKALADHVPDEHRDTLGSVSGAHGLTIPPGRRWRRDLQLIDLQGLILLVGACTKRTAAPFKQWVAEVIEAVHREGSYSLGEAEVQSAEPGAPIAYAMPEQIAEAVVRLEAHSLQAHEERAGGQRASIELHREMLAVQRETLAVHRETLATQKAALAVQQAMVRAMECLADRLDAPAVGRTGSGGGFGGTPAADRGR